MFKEIKATFKVSRDTAHLDRGFKLDRSNYTFTIERVVSGAFAYGDRSAHEIYINGQWYKGFDTRYDCIATDKEQWLDFWKNYIEEDFGLELELVEYNEKMVEIKG